MAADTGAFDVSVVVPTRGRPNLLPRTLDSIRQQDFPGSIECIVVRDEPGGGEPAPIRVDGRVALRELRNERAPGLPGARNTGIMAARGRLVAFCDDDDWWDPRKLRLQVAAMQERADAVVVSCANVVHCAGRQTIRRAPRGLVTFQDLLRSRMAVLHSSTILARRHTVIDRIGLVDESIPRGASEDYEWQLRAARIAPIRVVDEPLVEIEWHDGSLYHREWDVYVGGLEYILGRYGEFAGCPRGRARLEGQIAFGYASMRDRREAARWIARCIRHDWRQPRGYLALMVGTGLLPPDRLVAWLNVRGKSV